MRLTLSIYDATGKNVERVAGGETVEIMFGTVQAIMELLDINEQTGTFELLRKVSSAYKELTVILGGVFPDITEDEWKRVKVKELVIVLLDIIKSILAEFQTIPVEPKNALRA